MFVSDSFNGTRLAWNDLMEMELCRSSSLDSAPYMLVFLSAGYGLHDTKSVLRSLIRRVFFRDNSIEIIPCSLSSSSLHFSSTGLSEIAPQLATSVNHCG